MSKVLIIDSSYLIFRSYYAYPHLNTGDKPTGALFGYAKTIHKLVKDYSPEYLYIAGDLPTPTWRHKLLTSYKAGRPEPSDELKFQFPLVADYARSIASDYYTVDEYEADDIILNLAQKFIRDDPTSQIIVFSADRDLYQMLIQPQVFFVRNEDLYGCEKFRAEFGIDPTQWVDYKALVGDSSDNLKGVAGIGPKTATIILQNCETLLNIYAYIDGTLDDPKIQEYLDKNPKIVAKIKTDFEVVNQTFHLATLQLIPELEIIIKDYNLESARGIFEQFSFKSLITELDKMKPKKILLNSENMLL